MPVQATVCAKFGLECIVYMGAKDMERQALNVFRMRLMGAEVRAVHSGTKTLKDATSEAIRDWVTNVESTHYILGSAAGPHPYPMMVRPFHFSDPSTTFTAWYSVHASRFKRCIETELSNWCLRKKKMLGSVPFSILWYFVKLSVFEHNNDLLALLEKVLTSDK